MPGKEKNRPIVSPLESLTEEISAVGVQRFWMYQLTEFLQEAEKHLAVEVSDLTIKDAGMLDRAQKDVDPILKRGTVGEGDLRAALGHVAAHTVESNPRFASGYNSTNGDGASAEIFVPLRVAVRGGPNGLANEIARALAIVDLYIETTRVNLYILALSDRLTPAKEKAYRSAKQALKLALPRGVSGSLKFAFFTGDSKNELCVYEYEG